MKMQWISSSYSPKLAEISKHYCYLNNKTLEIRTVSGKYLIAMKLMYHREFRNDISDVVGIIIEERCNGNNITLDEWIVIDMQRRINIPPVDDCKCD